MATPGSVAYQFDRRGEIRVEAIGVSEEAMMEVAIEVGAEDVVADEGECIVYTVPTELAAVASGLREAGYVVRSEKLVSLPQNLTVVEEVEVARKVMKLYDLLDDYSDTLNVFTNFEVADEILESL